MQSNTKLKPSVSLGTSQGGEIWLTIFEPPDWLWDACPEEAHRLDQYTDKEVKVTDGGINLHLHRQVRP